MKKIFLTFLIGSLLTQSRCAATQPKKKPAEAEESSEESASSGKSCSNDKKCSDKNDNTPNANQVVDHNEITHEVRPKITIKHGSKRQAPSAPVELILCVLGKSEGREKVFKKERIYVPSLKKYQPHEIELEPISVTYTDQKDFPTQKFHGYAMFFMHNNKVVDAHYSSKKIEEDFGEAILEWPVMLSSYTSSPFDE